MAFRTQKISQMTPKGADLEATDLIEVSTIESGSYVTRSITGQELIDAIPLPPTGLTIGTTPIASGTIGRVLFQGTGNVLQQSSSLAYDDTTKAFSVIGNQNATTNISVVNTDTTNASSRARVSVTSGTIIGSMTSIIGNDFYLGTESAHNVNFTTAGTTRFNLINSTGNLNIGTLASDIGARLGVRGSGSTSATKTLLVRNLANTDLLTIWDDGAIGVNTSTNAGFRLDVNGTAAFRDAITLSNAGDRGRITWGGSYFTFQALGTQGISLMLPSGTRALSIPQATGNVLINTTTDAGFKLDVNGTARVNSTATTGLTITQGASGDGIVIQNGGYIQMASTRFRAFSSAFQFQDISYNTRVNLSMSGFSYFNSGGNYTFGSLTEVTSAIVNVDSTTKGFLPPRMTTTQKNAIASPATGLQIYDTTLNRPCFYDGTTWITL